MEVIGFERINCQIGRAELEWMAKSWPMLNLMYGLGKGLVPGDKPDIQRAQLKVYFQQLRPDVVHDGLFVNDIKSRHSGSVHPTSCSFRLTNAAQINVFFFPEWRQS